MLWLLLIVILILACTRWTRKKSGWAIAPRRRCNCGSCATCRPCAAAAATKTPLNAPSRKAMLSDAAAIGWDAVPSKKDGFDDRGDLYGSSAWLNQNYITGPQKDSPSEYELERHRVDIKNPEQSIMDNIYAMDRNEEFEGILLGLSKAINPQPLIIKSDETRDQMLFRSLTDGNIEALIRQSQTMGRGDPAKGYI
jgi:hypothetical protein